MFTETWGRLGEILLDIPFLSPLRRRFYPNWPRRATPPGISAVVRDSTETAARVYNTVMSEPLVIFLHSDGYDRIYQAVNMIATAASTGRTSYLFLFYHALGSYVAGSWDDMNVSSSAGRVDGAPGESPPWAHALGRSFELGNLPSLYEVLESAKDEDGEVTVYACSNSMRYLDLDPESVKRHVDGIVGLSTMLEISAGAHQVLYL